jgi:hypothetical protein
MELGGDKVRRPLQLRGAKTPAAHVGPGQRLNDVLHTLNGEHRRQ